MRVFVNGEPRELPAGTTVAQLLEQAGAGGPRRRGVAVALDSEVVPRSAWGIRELSEGQKVELLAAMQGG